MNNYSYPIDSDWNKDEIVAVIHFLQQIETAYEGGVSRDKLIDAYRGFKAVVPDKSGEKRIGKEFEKQSGYSLYGVMKQARESETNIIRLKEGG